jgi:hypothetical protein
MYDKLKNILISKKRNKIQLNNYIIKIDGICKIDVKKIKYGIK